MSETADCLICRAESSPQEAIVFRDDLWAAEVVDGYEVPGWIILRARRHAELVTGLSAAELAGYGERVSTLVAAVAEVTDAEAVYQLVFGENYRHFHVLVAARTADVPPQARGGNYLGLREQRLDRDAALALVPRLRAALAAPHAAADTPDRVM